MRDRSTAGRMADHKVGLPRPPAFFSEVLRTSERLRKPLPPWPPCDQRPSAPSCRCTLVEAPCPQFRHVSMDGGRSASRWRLCAVFCARCSRRSGTLHKPLTSADRRSTPTPLTTMGAATCPMPQVTLCIAAPTVRGTPCPNRLRTMAQWWPRQAPLGRRPGCGTSGHGPRQSTSDLHA